MALSTDQKLDTLLAAFENFKDSQQKNHQSLEEKLHKFEADLESTKESQEEATERALKRIKRDRPLQFQRKGHEEQFRFNADIQDHVATASRQLEKLAPPDKDKPIIEKAVKELQEGASSLAERQKLIRFADRAENGWDAVAEYVGNSFADDEDDNKKMDTSDRSAGVKKRRKAVAANARKPKRFPDHREYGPPQMSYQGATRNTHQRTSTGFLQQGCHIEGQEDHVTSVASWDTLEQTVQIVIPQEKSIL